MREFPHQCILKKNKRGNPLVVQGLRLCSFTAEHLGSIPGQGTKIPPNAQYRQEKKKKKKLFLKTGLTQKSRQKGVH